MVKFHREVVYVASSLWRTSPIKTAAVHLLVGQSDCTKLITTEIGFREFVKSRGSHS